MTAHSRSRFPVAPVISRTVDGIVFASKGEMNRYLHLKVLERAGLITGLQLQPQFKVWINGIEICSYKADFRYVDKSTGDIVIEDSKSSGTAKDAAFRLRVRAVEAYHGVKIVMVTK